MRLVIGIILLGISITTGAILLASGYLGTDHVARTASGNTALGSWHMTAVDFDLNWSVVLPLGACLLVGLLCVLIPNRQPRG